MSKQCFIIGYGPGVGHGVATAFAGAGYDLALFSRTPEKHGSLKKSQSFAADAGDETALAAALHEAIAKVGKPDVLVYNAVAFRAATPTKVTSSELRSDFSTNVVGALVAAQTVLPAMRGEGTILFTGGGWALYPDASVCSTAIGKAGLRHLALMLNQEMQGSSIRVGTLTILGVVEPGTRFDPSLVGQAFLAMAQQPTADFQSEVQFR